MWWPPFKHINHHSNMLATIQICKLQFKHVNHHPDMQVSIKKCKWLLSAVTLFMRHLYRVRLVTLVLLYLHEKYLDNFSIIIMVWISTKQCNSCVTDETWRNVLLTVFLLRLHDTKKFMRQKYRCTKHKEFCKGTSESWSNIKYSNHFNT